MAFTKRQLNDCKKAGFYFSKEDNNGDLIANFGEDAHEFTMVARLVDGGIKAWVLIGPPGMPSPKSITYSHRNGFSPQYLFKSVAQAARMAVENPFY